MKLVPLKVKEPVRTASVYVNGQYLGEATDLKVEYAPDYSPRDAELTQELFKLLPWSEVRFEGDILDGR